MQLGYISLGHISIDGSKLKANASKHKAMSREYMKKEIKRLEKEIQEALETAQQEDEKDEIQLSLLPKWTDHDILDHQKRLQKIKEALKDLDERKPEKDSREPEKDQINFTDSESRIMPTKTQGIIQGYNPQLAVDADHQFIVGYKMSNHSNDKRQFQGVLASVQENTDQTPEKVSADNGYFTAENISTAEKAHVDAYISASKEGKKNRNPYDKSNFSYIPENDTYVCPAGHTMKLKKTVYANNPDKETKWSYRCEECLTCPFQKDCVKSKTGKRTVDRKESDLIREAMRTKVQSDEGKMMYAKRLNGRLALFLLVACLMYDRYNDDGIL